MSRLLPVYCLCINIFWMVEGPSPTEEVTVNINVGGFRFETRLATLRKFEYSSIAQMFPPGRWFKEGLFDREQSRFIDRNGEAFAFVLDHLRGKSVLPTNRYLMDRLMDDAEIYGLWELQRKIYDHDLNCREVMITFEDIELKFRIDELRKERSSTIAMLVEHLYDNNPYEPILRIDLSPHYLHDNTGNLFEQRRRGVLHAMDFVTDMQKKFYSARLFVSPSNEVSAAGYQFFDATTIYWILDASRQMKCKTATMVYLRCALRILQSYMKSYDLCLKSVFQLEISDMSGKEIYQRMNMTTVENIQAEAKAFNVFEPYLNSAVAMVSRYFGLNKFADLVISSDGFLRRNCPGLMKQIKQ